MSSLYVQARRIRTSIENYIAPAQSDEEGVSTPRTLFKDALPLERFLAIGSCIPVVSNSIGVARVFYGVLLVAYATAEAANKVAQAQFSDQTTLFEKIVVLKDGVAFALLKGATHIAMGITAQSSILGNISCAVYEFILRPYLFSASINTEPTVDAKCFEPLLARVKQHPLWVSVQYNVNELGRLVFNSPPAEPARA